MSKKIFLKRFLQQSLPCSSQEAINIIEAKRVRFNGKIVTTPLMLVPIHAQLCVDGRKLAFKDTPLLYYVFNKPIGVLCQKDSSKKTVYDYINMLGIDSATKGTLFSVGRLDFDTEGLLLITNDGGFAKRVISPDFKVPKTYTAHITPCVRHSSLANLRRGVNIALEGKGMYKTEPAQVTLVSNPSEKESILNITIREGKKRQIRKMLSNQGYTVIYLKRIAIGGLELGEIPLGSMQVFKKEELINLIYHRDSYNG